ncbi:MAG: Fic family protein [Methylococcaceae bacterium]|nr:Fic family protein [Methylococcaceae bacterium]
MPKYQVSGSQGLYQPGSNNLVLANKLGLVDLEEMNEAELFLLEKLYEEVLLKNFSPKLIQVADIKTWHRKWLGNIYDWAGEERSVNMSKGDFHFSVAAQIPRLLEEFELEYLNKFTPCTGFNEAQLIEAIAVIHIDSSISRRKWAIVTFIGGCNGSASRVSAFRL